AGAPARQPARSNRRTTERAQPPRRRGLSGWGTAANAITRPGRVAPRPAAGDQPANRPRAGAPRDHAARSGGRRPTDGAPRGRGHGAGGGGRRYSVAQPADPPPGRPAGGRGRGPPVPQPPGPPPAAPGHPPSTPRTRPRPPDRAARRGWRRHAMA